MLKKDIRLRGLLSSLNRTSSAQMIPAVWIVFNTLNFAFIELLSINRQLTRLNILVLNIFLAFILIFFLYKTRKFRFRFDSKVVFEWQMIPIIAIFIMSLIAGVFVSPNNWDSMTYHLARVAHWFQHKSVGFFPAVIERQNFVSPFGDYQSLVTMSLNSDRFAFLASAISAVLVISTFFSLCSKVGIPRELIFVGVFLILAPNFVSQIATTQVDLRALAFALIGIQLILQSSPGLIFLGIVSLGLVVGTKFLALMALIGFIAVQPLFRLALRNIREYKLAAILGVICAISINVPWLVRNFREYGNFTAGSSHIFGLNSDFDLRVIDLIRYAATNLMYYQLPSWNVLVKDSTNWTLHTVFNSERTDIPYGLSIDSVYPIATEDDVSSFVLVIAFLLLLIYFLICRQYRNALIFLLPIAFTYIVLAWQPWINRLLVAAFVVMTFIGVFLMSVIRNKYVSMVISFLAVLSLLTSAIYLFDNQRRGLNAIFNNPTSRISDYFIPRPNLEQDYRLITDYLEKNLVETVAIIGMEDSWEYPLLVMNPNTKFIKYGSGESKVVVCLDLCQEEVKSLSKVVLETTNGLKVLIP